MSQNKPYTPSEQEVRDLYADHCDSAAMRDGDYGLEFDRWLAAHDAQVARNALDGLLAAMEKARDKADMPQWGVDALSMAIGFTGAYMKNTHPEEPLDA